MISSRSRGFSSRQAHWRGLGELALGLGGRRPLLVTDPGLAATGHPRRALASLRAAGLEAAVFDGVEENPTISLHVAAGVQAAFVACTAADLLIAVGGGSAMDVAKGINFTWLTNGGQAWSTTSGFVPAYAASHAAASIKACRRSSGTGSG